VRVALVSYRSKPHCGGQGVYVRHLSRELVRLGHEVEVFSGQPYPVLDDGVHVTKVPSLDLYREPDPFRTPRLSELRDLTDVQEVLTMWTAGFPEPRTFSKRVLRVLRERAADFDVVHDNQALGSALLGVERQVGLPLVTTIHHPISIDRRIDIASAPTRGKRLTVRRWYGFVRMQARVAARVGPILTVSGSSKHDIVRDFGALPEQVHILPLGVDDENFRPRGERVPGRIVAVASADSPLKGVATLLRAVAKLATERDVHVVVVGRPTPGGPTDKLVGELSLGDRVRFVSGISDEELGELLSSAEIAAVPSLYEGFSLPAVEHMASGTPLVASRTGALPEVVGDAAVLVEPGDVEELAAAFRRLHDSPEERERVGAAGYARVQERFTWSAVARATVGHYQDAIARRTAGAVRKEHGPADRGL
jgi:glycosyltransferase involved in cell wall biosynthesis